MVFKREFYKWLPLNLLIKTLREHGMGLVPDLVPNHMGVLHADNAWWLDVLEKGRASAYARYFDIDWSRGKLLLPVLGKHYGEVLEGRELKLEQGISQLLREVWPKPRDLDPARTSLGDFSGGAFKQLNHVLGNGRIEQVSRGNPFYALEIARALAASGSLPVGAVLPGPEDLWIAGPEGRFWVILPLMLANFTAPGVRSR